jgi:hypothetical protein
MKKHLPVIVFSLLIASLLLFPSTILAAYPTPTLTRQQIANRERKARLKAEEKARVQGLAVPTLTPEERARRREARLERKRRLEEQNAVRAFLPNAVRQTESLQVTNLDYTCWRWQSDSEYPVFINKHKPYVDMKAKLDRCFVDVAGYDDADYLVTYRVIGGPDNGHLETAETDRATWEGLQVGSCYNADEAVWHKGNDPYYYENDDPELVNFSSVACR